MINKERRNIDGYDLVFSVAMLGGFWTDNWIPMLLMVALGVVVISCA